MINDRMNEYQKMRKSLGGGKKDLEKITSYLAQARLHLDRNSFDQARDYANRAIAMDPDNREAQELIERADRAEETYMQEQKAQGEQVKKTGKSDAGVAEDLFDVEEKEPAPEQEQQSRVTFDDIRKRAEEAKALREAEEARRAEAESQAQTKAEEAKRMSKEIQQRRKEEEAKIKAAEEEARQKLEEARKMALEAEELRKAEEVRIKAAEEEAKKHAEEARRIAAEAEALRKAEEEARRREEEEARRRAQEIAMYLEEARECLKDNAFSKAREVVKKALGVEDNPESQEMLVDIDKTEKEYLAEQERIRKEEATRKAKEEAEAKRRAEEITRILSQARMQLDKENFDQARECVNKALMVEQDNRESRNLLIKIDKLEKDYIAEQERVKREEAQKKAEAIAVCLREAQEHLHKNQFDDAKNSVLKALEVEENEEARALLSSIEKAKETYIQEQERVKREEEQRRKSEEIAGHLRAAQESVEKNAFEEARIFVGKALEVEETPEVQKIIRDIEKAEARYIAEQERVKKEEAARKTAEQIDGFLRAAQIYLDNNNFIEARNNAGKALEVKDNTDSRNMMDAIDAAEKKYKREQERVKREEEEKRKSENIALLLRTAQLHMEHDDYSEARSSAQKALDLGESREAQALMEQIAGREERYKAEQERIRKAEEEKKRAEEENRKRIGKIAAHLAEARVYLENNRFEEARISSKKALEIDDNPEVRELLSKIDEAENIYRKEKERISKEEEARKKEQKISGLLKEAGIYLENKRFEKARDCADSASKLQNTPEVQKLLNAIDAAEKEHLAQQEQLKKQEEQKREKAEESRLKAEAEARRKAEEEAKKRAEEEVKRKSEEAARRKAQEEAEKKGKEEAATRKCAEKISKVLKKAEISLTKNKFEKARDFIKRAFDVMEESRGTQELLTKIDDMSERIAEAERAKRKEEEKRQEVIAAEKQALVLKKAAAVEAKQKAGEEAQKRAAEERSAREEAKRQAEEARQQAAEEAKKKAAEEQSAREEAKRQAEEARQQAAEEAQKKAAEERSAREEAKRQAEEARQQAKLEAANRAEEKRRQAEESRRPSKEAQERVQEERTSREEAKRQAEESRQQAKLEAAKRAEEKRQQAEEARREEKEARRQAEEARQKAAEEARKRADQQRKAKEEARREAEKTRQKAKEEMRKKAEEERKKKEAQYINVGATSKSEDLTGDLNMKDYDDKGQKLSGAGYFLERAKKKKAFIWLILGILVAVFILSRTIGKIREVFFGYKEEEKKMVEFLETVPVKVYKVKRMDFKDTLPVLGRIEGFKKVDLRFAESGLLESFNFEEGERILEGDIISSLDQKDALLKLKYAGLEMEKAKKLYEVGGVDKMAVDQKKLEYESAKRDLEKTNIYAPSDGYLGSKEMDTGSFVTPQDKVGTFVDFNEVYAAFDVIEEDSPKVELGQTAEVFLDAYPGATYTGTVDMVSPMIEGRTRTQKIKIELDNDENKMKPGMFARAIINTYEKKDALIIPSSAFKKEENKFFVYVVLPEGKEETEGAEAEEVTDSEMGVVEQREIKIDYLTHDVAEVGKGLQEGELIIRELHQEYKDKEKVEITEVQETIF